MYKLSEYLIEQPVFDELANTDKHMIYSARSGEIRVMRTTLFKKLQAGLFCDIDNAILR